MPRLARMLASVVFIGVVTATAGTIPPFTTTPVDFPGIPDTGIALDAEGNVWVLESKANRIGKLTPAGTYTTFKVPSPLPEYRLAEIVLGPDGNLWFTENMDVGAAKIGRITPDGVITEFPLPSPLRYPSNIAAGPDGNVWFEAGRGGDANSLVRISTVEGTLTQFPINFSIVALGSGVDGNLWAATFSDQTPPPPPPTPPSRTSTLLKISPSSGAATSFALPVQGGFFGPQLIAGPDGNVWFAYRFFGGGTDRIGRVTPEGAITLYPMATADSDPHALAIGQDMNLWFTERKSRKIGQLIISSATDSGQVTINESEVFVDQYMEEMFLMPSTPRGSLSAVSEVGVLAEEKCPEQTFLIKYHEENSAGSAHLETVKTTQEKCADLSIMLTWLPREMAADGSVLRPAGIKAFVMNHGPHDAVDVNLRIFVSDKQPKTEFWVVLPAKKGEEAFFTDEDSVIFDGVVYSSYTPDQKPKNNRYRGIRRNRGQAGIRPLPVELTDPLSVPKRGK